MENNETIMNTNSKDNTSKVPNVPNLRFRKYNQSWSKYKVSNLLEFKSTNSLSWDNLNYDKGKIKNLHYGLIHQGVNTLVKIGKDILPFINENDVPKKLIYVKNGDIVFADASEDTIEVGKAVEFYDVGDEKIVCGLHTIHGINKLGCTIIGYKGYAFNSFPFHKQLRRLAQGSKIYSINPSNFNECYIGIPSLEEQQEIVDLLSKIDERLNAQSKIIEDLELEKTSISNRFFKKTIVSQKEGYQPFKLELLLKERKIYAPKNSEYPHVTLSKEGIYDKGERYNRDFLVKDEDKQYKITKYNDICYNPANLKFSVICRNTYGDAIFSPIYVTFEVNKKALPEFMELYLTNHDFIGRVRRYEEGTVYERMAVSPSDFLKEIVYIPSIEGQLRIVNVFKAIQNKIELEKQVLEKLKEQKKFLLSNMFI